MKGILWFAVIICAVRGASLIKRQSNRERQMSKQRQDDDDIIIILQNILKSSWKPPPKTSPVCTSQECIKQSMNMSRMMDPTADPCTDFYQYACGGWLAQPLPPDEAKWSVFSVMAEQTEHQLRSVIEKQKDSDDKVAQLVYKWYTSCTNKTERDRLGPTPLLELINETMKTEEFAPFMINQWLEGEWNLEETLASVHRKVGVSPLFKVSLDIDPTNSSSPTHLALSKATPLLSSEAFYISEDPHAKVVIKAYASLLVRLTVLLGGSRHPEEQVIQALKEILQFEADVIKQETQKDNASEGQIAIATIKDLQDNIPGFDWRRYFTVLLEGISNETLLQRETIFVDTPGYLKRVIQLIKNKPNRTIANFIVWNIIYKYGPYLSTDFHNAYLEFARKSYGIRRSSPLWQRCIRSTDKSLDMGVAFLFVNDSGVGNESLIYANNMVRQIRQAFLDNLKSVTWMDDRTKKAAKIKAKAIFQQIGYPQFIMNSTLLELYFAGLEVDENTYFKNRLREISLRMKNTLLMRGQPLDRYSWEMNPDEVNAYYSPNYNKIVVPAGILRPPFYHVQHPHAENFGAIGFVVGHELTHGFDSNGAMFDDHGNLANWWTKASLAHFYARERCLVEEYNQCQIEGFHLSGTKTLQENTADNGGLKLAYKAYHKWLDKHDHDTTLPNLGLNSDQLFFLSFAQIWCEKVTPGYALNDLASNTHSPGKFRVDVTLKNNKDFARAFNCPYGTVMNPFQKCAVW